MQSYRRSRRSIDDTLRLTLAVQRRIIATLTARVDQVQQQADRQDAALTEAEARIVDLEAAVRGLRRAVSAQSDRLALS